MNILLYASLFAIAFIIGALSMGFAYAWNVMVNDRVLAIDKKVGYCRFMDKKDYIFQEVIENNKFYTR